MFEYQEEYQYIPNIMLNVTNDCNLQCRYCFVEQSPQYMSLEIAKDAVDWVYKNIQQRKKMKLLNPNWKSHLYFFGGEPILCYDSIIVPIINYCKEKYPNSFTFGITTNGTLLDKEKIDFFKENNFYILLSIDGDKETQDYNRPCKNCNLSSFNLLEKNIPYLLQNFPNTTFRSTIFAPTVQYMFKNYLYAETMGFKNYIFIPDDRESNWTEETLNIYREEIGKIYCHKLLQIITNSSTLTVSNFNQWLQNTVTLLSNSKENFNNYSINRCGLGTAGCAIGWDGNIYGCQEQVSKSNKSLFLIGNIYEGIDIKKHNNLLTFYDTEIRKEKILYKECEKCLIKSICESNYSICPSLGYDIYNNFNTISKIQCETRKNFTENSIMLLNILSQLYTKEEVIIYIKKIMEEKKWD